MIVKFRGAPGLPLPWLVGPGSFPPHAKKVMFLCFVGRVFFSFRLSRVVGSGWFWG